LTHSYLLSKKRQIWIVIKLKCSKKLSVDRERERERMCVCFTCFYLIILCLERKIHSAIKRMPEDSLKGKCLNVVDLITFLSVVALCIVYQDYMTLTQNMKLVQNGMTWHHFWQRLCCTKRDFYNTPPGPPTTPKKIDHKYKIEVYFLGGVKLLAHFFPNLQHTFSTLFVLSQHFAYFLYLTYTFSYFLNILYIFSTFFYFLILSQNFVHFLILSQHFAYFLKILYTFLHFLILSHTFS